MKTVEELLTDAIAEMDEGEDRQLGSVYLARAQILTQMAIARGLVDLKDTVEEGVKQILLALPES